MNPVLPFTVGKTTHQDVDEFIREIEVEQDLFSYRVDGWCVWPVLRFWVAERLAQLPISGGERGLRRSQKIFLAAGDLPGLLASRRSRCFVSTYTSARSELQDGRYRDIYFDDLLPALGSHFKLEAINNMAMRAHSTAALLPSQLTTTGPELAVSALLRAVPLPAQVEAAALGLSSRLQSVTGLPDFSLQAIRHILGHFYWAKRVYSRLLQRIRPEIVLTADPGEHVLSAAAHECAIPVVEFQHGFINRYHWGYSYTEPALDQRGHLPLPDRIFLYGDYWKSELDANGFWGNALRPVGSLRMERALREKLSLSSPETCTLTFCTQGLHREAVIAFLGEFLRLADGRLSLRLNIKLHPIYDTDKSPYQQALGPEDTVRVFLASEQPSTYDLIAQSHFHMSISSTCHYEALALRTPTIILPFTSSESLMGLHQAGHAFLVRSPQELLEVALQWKSYRLPEEVGDWYFKANALENMKREIAALVADPVGTEREGRYERMDAV